MSRSPPDYVGLNAGWNKRIPMSNVGGDCWELHTVLPPGCYPYKFIMDGIWSYDADLPTRVDGDNINNVEEVLPEGMTEQVMCARERVLKPNGRLTPQEIAKLRAFVGVKRTPP
jgi:hypothetical protein